MKYMYLTPRIDIIKYNFPEGYKYNLQVHGQVWKSSNKQNPYEFEINEVAKNILILFDGTRTIDEIVLELSDLYNENNEKVELLVNNFIELLEKEHGFSVLEQPSRKIKNKIFLKDFDNKFPTVACIELTSRCNVRCKHCYGHFGACPIKDIPIERLSSMFEDLSEIGILTVELTGGDPSTYPYISEAIELAFKSGIESVMLLTNGIHLSPKLIKTIEKYKEKMFLQIDLHSLDSDYYDWFTGSKNNLWKVKRNIDILIEKNINVRIVSIITPSNFKELNDIVEWSYTHGAVSFASSLVTEIGRAKNSNKMDRSLFFEEPETLMEYINDYDKLALKYPDFMRIVEVDNKRSRYCGAITSQLSIRSDGKIKLCTMDTGDYFDLKLGNIFKDNIKEVYIKNADFISNLPSILLPDAEGICKECEHSSFCNGCLLRGLIRAEEIGEKCMWYETQVNKKIKNRIYP